MIETILQQAEAGQDLSQDQMIAALEAIMEGRCPDDQIARAYAIATIALGFILHRFIQGQIDGRLDGQIVFLQSLLRVAPDGTLSLSGDADGPPFDRPGHGWYWYAETAATYLLGVWFKPVMKAIWVVLILVGAAGGELLGTGATAFLTHLWDLADTLNGLMAIPNLIGLLLLSGVLRKLVTEFDAKRRSGEINL